MQIIRLSLCVQPAAWKRAKRHREILRWILGLGGGNKQTNKNTGHDFSDGALSLENLGWKIAIQIEKELKTFAGSLG